MRIYFDKACKIFAASALGAETAPFFLKCVMVDPKGQLIATDGYIAAIVSCRVETDPGEEVLPALVPAELFKLAIKQTASKIKEAKLEVSIEKGQAIVNCGSYDGVSRLVLEHKFPQWANLIPDNPQISLESQTLDTEQLKRLGEALGTSELTIVFTGRDKQSIVLPVGGVGKIGAIQPLNPPSDDPPHVQVTQRLRSIQNGGAPVKDAHGSDVDGRSGEIKDEGSVTFSAKGHESVTIKASDLPKVTEALEKKVQDKKIGGKR